MFNQVLGDSYSSGKRKLHLLWLKLNLLFPGIFKMAKINKKLKWGKWSGKLKLFTMVWKMVGRENWVGKLTVWKAVVWKKTWRQILSTQTFSGAAFTFFHTSRSCHPPRCMRFIRSGLHSGNQTLLASGHSVAASHKLKLQRAVRKWKPNISYNILLDGSTCPGYKI